MTDMSEILTQEMSAGGQAAQTGAESARRFIAFTIGQENYAIDIMAVREIKGWTEITPLPNQPDYMRGVLNLRGVIVPIYDVRRRFGGEKTEPTKTHVIIIANVSGRIIGLLVDAVSDILTVKESEIGAVPDTDQGADAEYLSGLVTIEDKMVAILRLEKLHKSDVAIPSFLTNENAETDTPAQPA